MLVLRALLGFSFVELLCQSLAHFQDSLIVLRALIEFSFVGLLRKYLLCAFRILSFDFLCYYRAQFQDPISLDFYVRISSVFRILIHSIVMLYFSISSTFMISFMRLLHQYLEYFQDFLSVDCYVRAWCIFRIQEKRDEKFAV